MNPSEMTDEELTKAISEEVMGWKPQNWMGSYWEIWSFGPGKGCIKTRDWQPLTRPDHWWMLVERMVELGWDYKCERRSGSSDYLVLFYKFLQWPNKNYECRYHNLGRAVCEAA